MQVFISWSGESSKNVAAALRDWLPKVLPLKTWMSDFDIGKGAMWRVAVAKALSDSKAGIVCCTRVNLNRPWLLFEAGAIGKRFESGAIGERPATPPVCTYLLDVEDKDLYSSPLSQFNSTRAEKADTRKLVHSLYEELDGNKTDKQTLDELFDFFWPKLEERLNEIRHEAADREPEVAWVEGSELFTMYGIDDTEPIAELSQANPLEQLYFQWADATEGGEIRARIDKNERRILIAFDNPDRGFPGNVAIRLGGRCLPLRDGCLPRRDAGASELRFKVRVVKPKRNSKKNYLSTVQLGVRLVDFLGTHWKHIDRQGYQARTVDCSDEAEQWKTIAISLKKGEKWELFDADGNWRHRASQPDFRTVLALIVEVGSEHAERPGPGRGMIEIKDIELEWQSPDLGRDAPSLKRNAFIANRENNSNSDQPE